MEELPKPQVGDGSQERQVVVPKTTIERVVRDMGVTERVAHHLVTYSTQMGE